MLLFGVFFPLLLFLLGTWFVYLAARSWHACAPRPSRNLALASGSPRVRRFLDRCILPFGLCSLSLGTMLGLADAMAHYGLSANRFVAVVFGLAAVFSVTFLALTYSVYRYWRPRRLIPAYLRYEVHADRSQAPDPR